MSWMARLKKTEEAPQGDPAKTAKTLSAVFAGTSPEHFKNSVIERKNEETLPGKNGKNEEMEVFAVFAGTPPDHIGKTVDAVDRPPALASINIARLALFTDRGLGLADAQALVDRLALRDQQHDERRVCLECMHMSGTVNARRCGQWRMTRSNGPPMPADMVDILQRCRGFAARLNRDNEGAQ